MPLPSATLATAAAASALATRRSERLREDRAHDHWSMRLLRRGFPASDVAERLKDSWTALGVVAALAASMAFDVIASADEDDWLVLTLNSVAFGLASSVVVHTALLTVGANMLPEETMLRSFLTETQGWYSSATTASYQCSMIALMASAVVRSVRKSLVSLAAFQSVLFAVLTVVLFVRFRFILSLAERLHRQYVEADAAHVDGDAPEQRLGEEAASALESTNARATPPPPERENEKPTTTTASTSSSPGLQEPLLAPRPTAPSPRDYGSSGRPAPFAARRCAVM